MADFYKMPVIPTKPHPSLLEKLCSSKDHKRAMVVHDYTPENNDEINLMRGEYVTIIDQLEDDGWWKGINERGSTGLFPSNYVQILKDETPPARPTRTRPATVKSDTTTTLQQPPAVPVGTRPSSLLTSNHSANVVPAHPIPTSPPPRPTTLPPIPTTRRSAIGHRRVPSIPLTSPDLPPVSPVHDRRTFFSRPTSIDKSHEAHMAKPPKIAHFAKTDPVAPPRVTTSESTPPVPRRSMPPTPDPLADEIRLLILAETEKIRKDFEYKLENERIERLKLQVELDELKKTLYEQ